MTTVDLPDSPVPARKMVTVFLCGSSMSNYAHRFRLRTELLPDPPLLLELLVDAPALASSHIIA